MDFTPAIPYVQVRRAVIRRALLSGAVTPRVALAMGDESQLLRFAVGFGSTGMIGCVVSDARSCLERLALEPYGLLLCTDVLDGGDVLELTATARARHPALKIIVISRSGHLDRALVAAEWIDGLVAERDMTFRCGALQAAVLAVLGGSYFRSESMRQQAAAPEGARPLSQRDYQVLHGLADGLTDREIAARLQISESTAKTYTKRLLSALGARNRLQALVLGLRHGLVRLS